MLIVSQLKVKEGGGEQHAADFHFYNKVSST